MKKYINIILGICLIILTILVSLDLTTSFDTFIYNLIISMRTSLLDNVFKVITFFGSTLFIVLLTIFLVIFFWVKKDKRKSLIIVSTIGISTIINNIIKIIIRRKRPTVLALVIEKSFSYPSGHTMASFSLYGILLYLLLESNAKNSLKIIGSIVLGILPILIAISRIYLGAHFATDVIGAMFTSLIIILSMTNIIAKKTHL